MVRQASSVPSIHSRSGREPRAQGEAKLERLNRALLRVIARFGAGGVTHRRVAKEARVSLSATTYYFQSKHDMVRQALASLFEEIRANVDRLVARYGGDAPGTARPEDEVEAARSFMTNRLQASADEHLTFIELLLLMARDPDTRRMLSKDRKAVRDFVVSLLERSHSTHPDEDADLLMALVTGLTLENLARGRPPGFEGRATRLVERVMTWISADGSAADCSR